MLVSLSGREQWPCKSLAQAHRGFESLHQLHIETEKMKGDTAHERIRIRTVHSDLLIGVGGSIGFSIFGRSVGGSEK